MTERAIRPERDDRILNQFSVAGIALVRNVLNELVKRREMVCAFLPQADNSFSQGFIVKLTSDYVEVEFRREEVAAVELNDQMNLDFVSLIDGVKTQFQARPLRIEISGQVAYLQCALPEVAYRMQRRDAYRVRPAPGSQPEIVVRTEPGAEISYEILDLSATGVSFILAAGPCALEPGDVFEHARLELGPRVPIPCTVVVQSVSEIVHPDSDQLVNRVGAEFVNLPSDVARMIQVSVQDAERAVLRFGA